MMAHRVSVESAADTTWQCQLTNFVGVTYLAGTVTLTVFSRVFWVAGIGDRQAVNISCCMTRMSDLEL